MGETLGQNGFLLKTPASQHTCRTDDTLAGASWTASTRMARSRQADADRTIVEIASAPRVSNVRAAVMPASPASGARRKARSAMPNAPQRPKSNHH